MNVTPGWQLCCLLLSIDSQETVIMSSGHACRALRPGTSLDHEVVKGSTARGTMHRRAGRVVGQLLWGTSTLPCRVGYGVSFGGAPVAILWQVLL